MKRGRFKKARDIIAQELGPGVISENARRKLLVYALAAESMHVFEAERIRAWLLAIRARGIAMGMSDDSDSKPRLLETIAGVVRGDGIHMFRTTLDQLIGTPQSLDLLSDLNAYWPDELSDADQRMLQEWCSKLYAEGTQASRLESVRKWSD